MQLHINDNIKKKQYNNSHQTALEYTHKLKSIVSSDNIQL